MLKPVLLAVLFSCSVLGAPKSEWNLFMDEVLAEAQLRLVTLRPLPDLRFTGVHETVLGVPLDLRLVSFNRTLSGPHQLSRASETRVNLGGTPWVQAEVALGRADLSFGRLEADFFGLRYRGQLGLSLADAVSTLTVFVHRDSLVSCLVDVKLTEPDGVFLLNLGESGLQRALNAVIEYVLSKLYVPYRLLQYFVFPDITPDLVSAFKHAATKVACRSSF